MRKLIFVAAAMCASQMARAQTPAPTDKSPEVLTCFKGTEMNAVFQSGDTAKLPRYAEGDGARVQRQSPNTRLIGQAKHIKLANDQTLGICEYSNHIGNVAVFLLSGMVADAYDETCDNGTCKEGDYWRSDWRAPNAGEDKPGQEMIKACYRDVDGTAYPSSRCGFTFPADR